MDCHDIRALLAFLRRGAEELDPTERAAIQQHLEACPDCTLLVQSEQLFDAALGPAMRDLPVPAGLQARVLARLAADRPRPWGKIAAAAAVLLVVAGLGGWMLRPRPVVNGEVAQLTFNDVPTDAEHVQQWYRDRGIEMGTLPQFEYQYLWSCDVVDFQGRRVPKLIFYREADARTGAAMAQVLVIQDQQFNTRELPDGIVGETRNKVTVNRDGDPGFVFLVATSPSNAESFPIREPKQLR
jgi:hypothetical protein